MTVVIFSGPTLSPADVARVLPQVRVLPPASCGDIYRVSRDSDLRAIGLIDGYFDHRLSVWHKEILWALQRGVRVYGAASMGALRAAELEPLGMIGVGRVFEQFRAGVLEDDDEVAVVHDEAARGYAMRSDAMVNLRATLAQAELEGLITDAAAAMLVSELKRLFYPQRNRQALAQLAKRLIAKDEAAALLRFIEERGVIDQKRLDATDMVKRLSNDVQAEKVIQDGARTEVRAFEYTNAWHVLRETVEREVAESASSPGPRQEMSRTQVTYQTDKSSERTSNVGTPPDSDPAELLERVREKAPAEYLSVLLAAVERAFALVLADAAGASVDARAAQLESERFRHERELLTSEQMTAWLGQSDMNIQEFSALIYGNALCARFAGEVRRAALQQVSQVLKNRGIVF